MAHNVEKITVQQAAGDITKGKAPETTVDNSKIEVFTLGSGFLYNPAQVKEKTSAPLFGNITGTTQPPEQQSVSTPLFGSNIVVDKQPQTTKVETIQSKPEAFAALADWKTYLNKIKYGVNKLDAVIDAGSLNILNEYGIDKTEIADIYRANPRLRAIISQMYAMALQSGIETA